MLFGRRSRTSNLEVELLFDNGQCCYRFSAEAAGDGLVFGKEHVCPGVAQWVDVAAPGTFPTVEGGTTWSGGHREAQLANLGVGSFAAYALPKIKSWRVHHFSDTGDRAGVRGPQAVRDNLRLKADGSNLAPFSAAPTRTASSRASGSRRDGTDSRAVLRRLRIPQGGR